jgi:hypothetical protein
MLDVKLLPRDKEGFELFILGHGVTVRKIKLKSVCEEALP